MEDTPLLVTHRLLERHGFCHLAISADSRATARPTRLHALRAAQR